MAMLNPPKQITAEVLELCKRIDPTQQPVTVPVEPMPGAQARDCFKNVQAKIAKDKGSVQHGWSIWVWEGVFQEGEFHAVWVSPEGKLIDVTPHDDQEKAIVFLPDSKRINEGKVIPNVRMALSKDPNAQKYLEVCDQIDSFKRVNAKGEMEMDLHKVLPLRMEQCRLYMQLGGTPPSEEEIQREAGRMGVRPAEATTATDRIERRKEEKRKKKEANRPRRPGQRD